MWPVGLITSTGVSSPIVKNGKVTGFYDGWIANRKFPVDMAGFGFSVDLLMKVRCIYVRMMWKHAFGSNALEGHNVTECELVK